jgi:hypothetical protein
MATCTSDSDTSLRTEAGCTNYAMCRHVGAELDGVCVVANRQRAEACDNLSLWKQYASDVINTINENGYTDWCQKNYLPDYEPYRRKYFSQSLVTADCATGLMNVMCLKHGSEPLSGDSSEAGAIARIIQNVKPPVSTCSRHLAQPRACPE